MKIKFVRMISPNGQVTEITEAEAIAIKESAFMRAGNVSVEGIQNGFQIKDQFGVTTLTAIIDWESVKNSGQIIDDVEMITDEA